MKLPTFDIEQKYIAHFDSIVGVDEAGRGPLAGPVVAAAARFRSDSFSFLLEEENMWRLIRDSKTLSRAQRELAYEWILNHFDTSVGIVDAETIDRINILQATFLAMKEAIGNIQQKTRHQQTKQSTLFLIDGNRKIPELLYAQETIVKGDSLSVSIAAASIVAKVTRDRMMVTFEALYPGYGFARHSGYGTKLHMEVLDRLGPTPIHRYSFAPVARVAQKFAQNKKS